MGIKCCHYCVPPKRHTACWDTCPDYIREKAEEAEKQAAYRKKRDITNAIYQERGRAVRKAYKRRRRK